MLNSHKKKSTEYSYDERVLASRNQALAKKVLVSLFVGFSLLVLTIAVKNKFTPAYDVMHMLGNALYTAPWSRILPYLVGVAAGWVLFTTDGKMPFRPVRWPYLSLTTTLATSVPCAPLKQAALKVLCQYIIQFMHLFFFSLYRKP